MGMVLSKNICIHPVLYTVAGITSAATLRPVDGDRMESVATIGFGEYFDNWSGCALDTRISLRQPPSRLEDGRERGLADKISNARVSNTKGDQHEKQKLVS